jgi:hypothetical protein
MKPAVTINPLRCQVRWGKPHFFVMGRCFYCELSKIEFLRMKKSKPRKNL